MEDNCSVDKKTYPTADRPARWQIPVIVTLVQQRTPWGACPRPPLMALLAALGGWRLPVGGVCTQRSHCDGSRGPCRAASGGPTASAHLRGCVLSSGRRRG